MLRMRSGLPRIAAKWAAQVAASVGATMVASLIYTALPRPALPDAPVPRPALTSGGKFAARAIVPVAYDGLDAMPLPQVTALPARLVTLPAWETPTAAAVERRAQKPVRAPLRAEGRRGAAPSDVPPRPATVAVVTAVEPVTPARAEAGGDDEGFMPAILPKVLPGLLPGVVSTARAAWSLTASASESLVARVVPQIP